MNAPRYPGDESHPSPAATVIGDCLPEQVGVVIGSYKLLQMLGEGGMGTVWVAEQSEPVKRRVALKLIKSGMDTTHVLRRFEAERQALALMDHQNIAKVLDAGTTPQGRPFFAMELIKGIPITKYCDQEHLTPRERLELFIPVCQAVQHAHQKGVIHRDLKPSNVLIALYDGKPVPKVIDFGVAKATSQKLTEQTLYTEVGQIVGTLEYMAPEQAELNNLDIDTRADIYSLGVILYELLAGSPPFTAKQLRGAAFTEMLRMIREVEPPKPSTRISSSDELPSIAANRKLEPNRLTRMIDGDLDWIVMKALEKDRARRYATANGFAADINRHLAGETVNAHPPSSAYRLKKFLHKRKGPVLAASLVTTALVLGLVGTAYGLRQALDARDGEATAKRAAELEAERAKAAEVETKARAHELKLVSDFQAKMLSQIDATDAGDKLMKDIREKFAAELAKGQPPVPADEQRKRATALEAELRSVNATDTAAAMIDRTILKPAIDAIGKQFKDQPVVDAQLRQTLADLYAKLGRYDDAKPLQEQALATRRRVLGDEHQDTLMSIFQTGAMLWEQQKDTEAEAYFREALAKQRRILGEEHRDTLMSLGSLGLALFAQGKFVEADPYLREALEKKRRVLGKDDQETLISLVNLGGMLWRQGKLAEAEMHFREALEAFRRTLGEDHSNTVTTLNNLGSVLHDQGKLAEAGPFYREVLEKRRRAQGEEHPDTLRAISEMGTLLQDQGKLTEAEPFYREALEKRRRVLGQENRDTLSSISDMGSLLRDQLKLEEAEPYFREALDKRRRVLGEDHPDTLKSVIALGGLRVDQGKPTEAVTLLAALESKARQTFLSGHTYIVARVLTLLGVARAGLAKNPAAFAAAEGNLLEAHGIYRKTPGPMPKGPRDCKQALVDFYTARNRAEPGKGYDVKAAEWKAKVEPMPK
jgi:eukaryotic-like serine/threonine-protein kinase